MMTEKRGVSELKTNPLSLAIYGVNEDVSDLAESIGQRRSICDLCDWSDITLNELQQVRNDQRRA